MWKGVIEYNTWEKSKFTITTRVYYPLLKKYWQLNLELHEVQTGQTFDRFFWGSKLISEYFESKI